MEQPFQPANELCLGHADLGLGGHPGERGSEVGELLLQVGGEDLPELADGPLVDLGEA